MLRPPFLKSIKNEPARYLNYIDKDIISPASTTVCRDYAIYNSTKNKLDHLLEHYSLFISFSEIGTPL